MKKEKQVRSTGGDQGLGKVSVALLVLAVISAVTGCVALATGFASFTADGFSINLATLFMLLGAAGGIPGLAGTLSSRSRLDAAYQPSLAKSIGIAGAAFVGAALCFVPFGVFRGSVFSQGQRLALAGQGFHVAATLGLVGSVATFALIVAHAVCAIRLLRDDMAIIDGEA